MSDCCFYCDVPVYPANSHQAKANPDRIKTRDHVIPQQQGGKRVVVACVRCNAVKDRYPADVFQYYLRHAKAKTRESMRQEFAIFVFELARFGLRASVALIQSKRRRQPPEPAPDHTARPRDNKGRFTRRDLRRKA